MQNYKIGLIKHGKSKIYMHKLKLYTSLAEDGIWYIDWVSSNPNTYATEINGEFNESPFFDELIQRYPNINNALTITSADVYKNIPSKIYGVIDSESGTNAAMIHVGDSSGSIADVKINPAQDGSIEDLQIIEL